MKRVRKLLLAAAIVLILCVLVLLMTPFGFAISGDGGHHAVVGFGNYGVPPRGGSCGNVGRIYPSNPFYGWPVQFRKCDWAIISAYFCTPNYFAGYTHWGIDLASFWSLDGSENIYGAAIVSTALLGKVKIVGVFSPPKYNWGMGNYVKIEAWTPNPNNPLQEQCSDDPIQDLNSENFYICWAPVADSPDECSGNPAEDLSNGVFDQCWHSTVPDCTFDPRTDYAHGVLEDCWGPTGWIATYMHMLDATVAEDDWVFHGDVIGHVDNTGNSTGNHLHYQINAPKWMNVGAVDPAPTFKCPGYDWDKGVEEGR